MLSSPKVEIGTRINYGGSIHTVKGFDGGTILLHSEVGASSRVAIQTLFGSEDFSIVGSNLPSYEPSFPDLLSPELLEEATELLAHLREAATGFRSGIPDISLKGEPYPHYDPSITKSRDRMAHKAKELDNSTR